MSQNTSTAVMQRRKEPPKSLDDFPTPPWATRALCEWINCALHPTEGMVCREPAANRGHMARPLQEYFKTVHGSDVHDYGYGFPVSDYLLGPDPAGRVDWTITNPPFRLAEAFIEQARAHSELGVAMIVRTAFLESIGRHSRLFAATPPSDILQFTERVVMRKGRLSEKGTTATAYCWLVWRQPQRNATEFHWIEPSRRRLERPGDYEGSDT